MLLIYVNAAAFTPLLPPEEAGLIPLLEAEVIDTFQYEQLLIYYALPLSVPQGELARLAEIFPDIEDMMPTAEQLEGYRPYDNRQIQRLFNDFPALADLEPVLRFNESLSKAGANGEIVVGINRSPVSELRGHRVRFRRSGGIVSADGNLALSDSGALWQGRRVDFSFKGKAVPAAKGQGGKGRQLSTGAKAPGGKIKQSSPVIKTQIGNFRQPVPGELFWGRFSPLTAAERADVETNWLYGGTNTWNGAALDVRGLPGAPMLGAGAFWHARPGERGAGGAVDWQANRQLKMVLGLTGFEIAGEEDAIYTAHLYGEYKGKIWRAVLESGLPLGQDNIIPALSLRINYRIRESSAQYRFISYPEDMNAPMSRVKRQLLTEAGEKMPAALSQPLQSPAVQKHSLRMTVPVSVPLADMMRFIPDMEFTSGGGVVRRVQGRAELRARVGAADAAVKHTYRIFAMGIDSVSHTSSASVSLQTGYPLEIRASGQSAYGHYGDVRNTYALELLYTALPNAVITPFVRGRYVSAHEYWFGLKSEIHLYKKTWTGITVEAPVNVKGAEGAYIKGSASYSF
ncbi:MAG: hypothetical protein FWC23_00415 [Chitinispirillia bacterium]|nr:hypothetical protein [Chitinispirillia bacterium]MCL2267638.1 hypothetical protein [Chitinispirillia bacterium]